MRILIIEDEEKIAQFMKRGLREEGYAVDVARDGEEGYALATVEDYDVVILDIMLPGMDGLSLLKKLRKKKAHLPIIMVTARSSVDDRVRGLDLGADDYITKPFAFEELLARIRAQLRKNHRQDTKIRYADLELDIKTHKVFRGGREIELSALVSEVVEALKPLMEKRQITLSCAFENPLVISADKDQLQQVVVNLMDNAIKYSPCGGRISVRTGQTGSNAFFSIDNQGAGISGDDVGQIFDRFYRGRGNREKGFGLGLSIARSIVELHEGRITVESTPLERTLFTVYLPEH